MVVEIARLFDSLATFDGASQRYRIKGVMGPDEYHDGYPDRATPGLDDNAYTNVMAVWGFTRVLKMLELMPAAVRRDLVEKLRLDDAELVRWEDMTQRMTVPFHGDGIISQFAGYGELEEFDWAGYREKYGDIQRLDRILEAEGDTPNRYKLAKQADVTMLFYLLPEDQLVAMLQRLGYGFSHDHVRRNIEYYLASTSHGSTLSSVVHAALLARIDPDGAWPLFRAALTADQTDAQGGTTKEGIHLGAMAGTIDILERSYLGIERLHNRLHINPRMPRAIRRLRLAENFRRRWFDLTYAAGRLEIALEADGGGPATVVVNGAEHLVAAGGHITVDA